MAQPAAALVGHRSTRTAPGKHGWPAKLHLILLGINAHIQLRRADRVGRRVTLRGRLLLRNRGHVLIGEHVYLDSSVATLELGTSAGGCLEIQDHVFINFGSALVASTHIRIGRGSLIGKHVIVMDTDLPPDDDASLQIGAPIILEERVWLGNRSTVLKGVRIGHDSVVAAGAVVTQDVPPRVIVAGNPAKIIREF